MPQYYRIRTTPSAACACVLIAVLFALILFSMLCHACLKALHLSQPLGWRGDQLWMLLSPPPSKTKFCKEIVMSDTKRPQQAPEVVERSEAKSATAVEAPDRRSEGQVREPLPKPVARPIVEVVAEIRQDAATTEQIRQPLPKPVARPIVEVVAEIRQDAASKETVRQPLPTPVARPIVEVVGEIRQDAGSNEQVRQPLPKPVARTIVEVVGEIRQDAVSNEQVRQPLPKQIGRA